jgi:hypothetical protein
VPLVSCHFMFLLFVSFRGSFANSHQSERIPGQAIRLNTIGRSGGKTINRKERQERKVYAKVGLRTPPLIDIPSDATHDKVRPSKSFIANYKL